MYTVGGCVTDGWMHHTHVHALRKSNRVNAREILARTGTHYSIRQMPPRSRAKSGPRGDTPGDSPGVTAARAIFGKMIDSDFFSDKVQHVYFYDAVSDASVAKLNDDIRAANMSVGGDNNKAAIGPKPIVVHVNCVEGEATASLSMMTIFSRSSTPICVMVDGASFSAATLLSIIAPYRVAATPHVRTLIHSETIKGLDGNRELLDFADRRHEMTEMAFRDVYLNNTRLTAAQLDGLMSSDTMLDTAFCMANGIIDRVLDIDNRQWVTQVRRRLDGPAHVPLSVLMTKTNWNSVTLNCPELKILPGVKRLDELLCQSPDTLKPIMFYCTSGCALDHNCVAVAARIRALRVPVYSVLDTTLNIWDYIPALYCSRRYMYAHGSIVINVSYHTSWGNRLPDIIHNTGLTLSMLRSILAERTTLPVSMLDVLHTERLLLSATECLKYGLCDEIVPLGGRTLGHVKGRKKSPLPSTELH